MIPTANRPYRDASDLQAILALVSARPPERVTDYPSIADLRRMFGITEVQANTRLWEDDGRLVGFAILDYTHNLRLEIAPGVGESDIAVQMVAWGMERLPRDRRENGEPIMLCASCLDDNSERIALLEGQGFVRAEWHTLHLIRPLDEPIPAPQLPAGFTARHVAGEHEVAALVALHRAAFGSENLTVEGRLSWMHTPEYDPELDLVAVAPTGALAAYVLCSISQEQNVLTGRKDGYTDPIATHPAFQRQGLARALLLTGFQLLKRRGVETAWLSTGSWNTAMQHTAGSVGFRVESTTLFFEKQMPVK